MGLKVRGQEEYRSEILPFSRRLFSGASLPAQCPRFPWTQDMECPPPRSSSPTLPYPSPPPCFTTTPNLSFIQFNSHLFIQYLLLFPSRPSQFPLAPLALDQSKFLLPRMDFLLSLLGLPPSL